ncbi:IclR family transcriptional regulator domain-containing protein [Natronoglycomyces albus]|uniref:ArsR family transcriptional regulator n=1 Tax=Natronoglycomyces albus TaxID=2811108 RepID=A0A895XWA7_9ACTN|nr:IclR family transcriptional regulator C-terminal domain-containing protein [Natronoglycomyces albus]QSB06510.1 ArsR family transcriptional regulator [Natronoglycomyces albus]
MDSGETVQEFSDLGEPVHHLVEQGVTMTMIPTIPPQEPFSSGEGSDVRVRRALIVEAIAKHGPMKANQISEETRIPRSSVYWHLDKLCSSGHLTKDKPHNGRYFLGERPLAAVPESDTAPGVPVNVGRLLQYRALETGYSLYMGKIKASGIAISAWAHGQGSPYIEDLEVGLHEAAHATALGQALLATLPPREVLRYIAANSGRRMPCYTSLTYCNPEHLAARLTEFHMVGIHTEVGQFRKGVACAAVVVKDGPGITDRIAVATVIPEADTYAHGPRVNRELRQTAAQLQPWLLVQPAT